MPWALERFRSVAGLAGTRAAGPVMSALAIAAIVFACVAGGTVLGMAIRPALPEHHFDGDSKDVVKTSMSLVATMAALVLGLLVASAKNTYDTQKDGLDQLAANITLLDTVLAQLGPSARESRESLRQVVGEAVARLFPDDARQAGTLGPPRAVPGGSSFYTRLLQLSPATPIESELRSQAIQIATSLGHERLLLIAHRDSAAVSASFLVVLSFWLVVLFTSFGLFAPRNALALVALTIAALSVSSAIFLTLELAQPFGGLIQLPSAPLRDALAHLAT